MTFCPKYYIRLLQEFCGVSKNEAVVEGLLLKRKMEVMSTKARKDLPDSSFAIPSHRKLPIHDAVHVRNALARMNQVEGGCDAECKARICRAAKKFGIESSVCNAKKASSNESVSVSSHEDDAETRMKSCQEKMKKAGKTPEVAKKLCKSLATE